MKKKFTILITAAFMLLTMMAQPGRAVGQTTHTLGWGNASGDEGTYTNFTATSGSVSGVLEFTTAKNSSSTAPAYNSNNKELRLYNASNGNGCSITITPASGLTITQVVITATSGYSSDVNYTVNGGSAIAATWNTNTTCTISGISANESIMIQNVKKSTQQLRIRTIAVTYTSGSSATATTVTIDATGITNTDVYISTAAGSLSATVTPEGESPLANPTITWSSSKTNIATINETTGVVTLVAKGTTTITASYAGETGVYTSSQATYELTVISSAPYVQPTEIEALLNDDLFGTNYGGTASGITDENPAIGTQDNVTITYAGSGNHYISSSQIRFYPNNKLTFEAPDGYEIKEIVFTSAGTWAATISANVGTYTSSTKTWTGSATSVLFTGSGSSRCDMSKADITIAAVSNLLTVTYDGNGNTGGTVPTDGNEYESDATVTVLGNTGNLEKAGHIWSGWCMNAGGTGDVYGPDYITTFTITENTTLYAKWNAKEITGLSYTGTPTKTEYYSGENFDPTGLTVTATFNDSSSEDVTTSVVWTPSPLTTGTTAVTGTYMGQIINVGGLTVTDAPGSQNNPYTVAQAIEATPASGTSANVYIHGIVSAFYNTSIVGDGSNYRYYISDDGSTTNQLLVYKGKGLDNVAFSNADDLHVGDIVVIYGGLTMYQSAPEIASGNYLYSWNRPAVDVEAPTFSIAEGGYAEAQTVALACATEGATIYYTLDNSTPDNNSTQYTDPIAVSSTTTIKAIAYVDQSSSTVSSATYYIKSPGNTHTVTEALAFGSYPVNNIFVQGIVSTAPTSLLDGGLLTYYVSVDGEATNQLQVYKGKNLGNTAFTEVNDIQVGDIVTIFGNVKIYQEQTEFDQGNYLVSFERPTPPADPSITFDTDEINLDAEEHLAEQIPFTYENFEVESYQDFSIQFYDANNAPTTIPDWISVAGITGTNSEGYKVTLAVISANEGDARSTYLKVYSTVNNEAVYSNLVTINQAAPVVPPTTENYELYSGALVEGDYLIVYNGVAMNNVVENDKLQYVDVTISNDVISTSNAAIVWHIAQSGDYWTIYSADAGAYAASTGAKNKAQMLADGTDDKALWTVTGDETYEFVNKQNTANSVNANLRLNSGYGFACYSTSTGGALSLYKKASTEPAITLDSYSIEANAEGLEGNLTVTYTNYENPDDIETVVWFCDENGENAVEYDWIVAEIDDKDVTNLYYIIDANNGAARTAYFKVHETSEDIYSELVTITQEAYVAAITVVPAEVTDVPAAGDVPEHTVTLANLTISSADDFEFVYCDSEGNILGNEDPKPNWIELADAEYDLDSENVYTMMYTIAENTETTPRTGYFKIGVEQTTGTVYSNLVTVTQEAAAAPTFTVSFTLDGGTFVPNEYFTDEIVEIEAGTYNLPSATKEGYTFDGWNDGNATYEAGAEYTVSTDIDFTAQWTVITTATINFNNTATGTAITAASVSGNDSMGNTWTITTEGTTYFYAGYSYCQVGSSSNSATSITFTTTLAQTTTITAIEAKFGGFSGTAGTITMKVGDETVGTGSLDATNDVTVTNTKTESGTVLTITVTNIQKGIKCYYISYTISNAPIINATVDPLAYNATSGSIIYEIDNYVAGTMAATTEADWISDFTYEQEDEIGEVGFTTTPNELYESRSATVTLTYTYDDSKATVTKDVTVTQAAAPAPTHTVSFSVNGTPDESLTETGSSISLPTESTWTPEGFVITGWALENSMVAVADPYVPTEDVTLYALLTYLYSEDSFELVTDASDLAAGDIVVIAALNSDYAISTTQNTNNRGQAAIVKSGNQIALSENVCEFVLGEGLAEDSWSFLDTVNDGYIYAASSSSNHLKTEGTLSNNSSWTISINENAATITAQGSNTRNFMQYNSSSSIFSCYASGTTTQQPICIYKKKEASSFNIVNSFTEPDATMSNDIPANTCVVVNSGAVLTFSGENQGTADNLIIEDGGQLIHDDPVAATIQRNVNGYPSSKATGKSGYELIASPVISALNVATETNLTEGGEYDLYYFDQSQAHEEWRNYKKEQTPVPFTSIENGKGYLYANSADVTISFSGTLKPSDENVEIVLDYEDGHPFTGWNLVGNPFACNAYAFDTIGKSLAFYKMNDAGDDFEATTGPIAPMEGIFVYASATGKTFEFTRTAPASVPGKGNLNLEIAQVVTSRNAHQATDNAIIRFDGGNGLEKFSFSENNAKLYFPQNGKDYAVVSAEAQGEMPVYFKAAENGTYTISFSMDNVEFGYLHLIDNKTGNDVDLLQTSSYTFEANTIDYASRFRLVFKAIGNENDSENNDFGFFDANGNLLILGIEGTATLQVMDVTGRTISSETFSGDYSKAINASAGVYMLRLIQGSNVRTQKVVVK